MANELKPCPFCGSKARMWPSQTKSDSEGSYEIIGCSNIDCLIEPTTEEYLPYAEAIAAWNTRPAPAATDMGLVTVETQWRYAFIPNDMWLSSKQPENMRDGAIETRELVTRSQAEAIIAAEREAQQRLLDIIEEANSDKEALQADNAALTARVKTLEGERDHWKANHDSVLGKYRLATQRPDLPVDRLPAIRKLEALEAKLAAAEKALERADDALQLEATASGHTYVKIALGEVRS